MQVPLAEPNRSRKHKGSKTKPVADLMTEALRVTGHDRGKAKVSERGCSGLWLHLLLALRPVIADTAADVNADADAADDGSKSTIIIMAVMTGIGKAMALRELIKLVRSRFLRSGLPRMAGWSSAWTNQRPLQ